MTEKYLKPYQYYADLYDKFTVEDFRRFEKLTVPDTSKDEKHMEDFDRVRPLLEKTWLNVAIEIKKVGRHRDKKKTITEWMKRDEEYDKIYKEAQPPSHIHCLDCKRMMFVSTKTLETEFDKKPTRVLFMYDCPLGHLPRRAFYSDGQEYRIEPKVCVKCHSTVEDTKERNGQLLTITDTCKKCGHVEVTEFDFSTKEEKPDPDFSKDRERFCLTDEEGDKAVGELISFEARMNLLGEEKIKEEKRDLYNKAKQLKKLTIIELEKTLIPVLEQSNFIKLTLKEPQINKDFVVPFIVYDSKPDRTDPVSCDDLKKVIKKMLDGTNWKLMSDGVMYRMGMLEGRLRGYEREEDLVKLVENETRNH